MRLGLSRTAAALLCALVGIVPAVPATRAQSSPADAPVSPISSQVSPQLFATMCALYAAGLTPDATTLGTDPAFATLVAQLSQSQGPATQALRQFYRDHALADTSVTVSRYVAFAAVAGSAPKFAVTLRREELPPDVLALDGFSEILSNFYSEAKIAERWRLFEPAYQRYAQQLDEPLQRVIFTETAYLRELVRPAPRTFVAYPEPLVGTRTSFRNIGDRYIVVLHPSLDSVEAMRHPFLHYLLDPLPLKYSDKLVLQSQLLRLAGRAPLLPQEYRDDWLAFYTECLVRAAELRVRGLKSQELATEINSEEGQGFVLVRPLVAALAKFEASEPSITLYFPDLIASVDVAKEQERLRTITFTKYADRASIMASSGGHAGPGAAPGPDAEIENALSQGQSYVAAKQAVAAEALFEHVLAKVPGEPRALYGLAVTSVMQGNAARARELFQEVVRASSPDPTVLAWSHVYLGRMHDLQDTREEALSEYRAALAVADAPEAARAAAQRGVDQPYEPAAHDAPSAESVQGSGN